MNSLTKKIIFSLFILLFMSITNANSQSENEKINNLIEQKRAYNKTNKISAVYKIQLYNGNETQAYKVRKEFEAVFPEYKVIIDASKQPDWKTQISYFRTRIEADRALNLIKEKYSGAFFVLEDKI